MRIALIGNYPIIPFQQRLGIKRAQYHSPTWNVNLARGLARLRDCEVHFIHANRHLPQTKTITDHGVRIHFVKAPPAFNQATFYIAKRLLIHRILSNIQPDIVHGHATEHGDAFVAVTSPFPNLMTLHFPLNEYHRRSNNLKGYKNWVRRCLETYSLRRSGFVVCTTEWMVPYVKENSSAQVFVIPNAVDDDFFEIQRSPSHSPTILYIGRNSPEKRVADLLKAFAGVKKAFPASQLRLAGPGQWEELRKLAGSLNIENSVVFVGPCAKKDIIKELEKATLLVLPSEFEAFGLVLAEAMAAGVPIVASRVCGIPFVVKDGETGLLFDVGNIDDLTDKICLLLLDSNLRTSMIQQGIVHARNRFHPAVIAKKHWDLYKTIIC